MTELAGAVGRPKSTVAHHVKVLVEAGMLRVVRTRRVRAIEERFYGRTARLFFVGPVPLEEVTPPPWTNYLADAAAESMPAYQADRMFANIRHARITRGRAAAFWERVNEVITEFSQLPREGDTVYGFVAGLSPPTIQRCPKGERARKRDAQGCDGWRGTARRTSSARLSVVVEDPRARQ